MKQADTAESRPAFLRFLDAFLQDRNIAWVLGAGIAILLGSSIMLVSTHWNAVAPFWKILILLGYTALIDGAGRICGTRGLTRTSTYLKSLTLCLLPVLFLLLPWAGGEDTTARIATGCLTLVYAAVTARATIREFFHGDQVTFLVAYLTLAVAGTLVPLAPVPPAVAGLALFVVFLAGTVKMNRHVFWLTEELRRPRVTAFLPITLLGVQFLALYLVHLSASISIGQLGFGLVLCSAPLLLAADAQARVFRQRTGDLVRPYPASLIVPIALALAAAVSGLTLTGLDLLAGRLPYTLPPAAAVCAALFCALAIRTRHRGFAWMALVAITLAYNFSPVFFAEVARSITAAGASAVHEPQLPLAFYGLTYMPLLTVGALLLLRWRRRPGFVFVAPVRGFLLGLSTVLLALSFSHPKALFPVGIVLCGILAAPALRLRDRTLAMLCGCTLLAAGAGVPPFARSVLGLGVSPTWVALLLPLIAAGLGLVSRRLDSRFPPPVPGTRSAGLPWIFRDPIGQVSLLGAFVSVPVFLLHGSSPLALIGAAVVGVVLLAHAHRRASLPLALSAWVWVPTALTIFLLHRDLDTSGAAWIVTAVAFGYRGLELLLTRLRGPRATFLSHSLTRLLDAALPAASVLILPLLLLDLTIGAQASLVALVSMLALAGERVVRRHLTRFLPVVYCGGQLAAVAVTVELFGSGAYPWAPALAVALSLLVLPWSKPVGSRETSVAPTGSLHRCVTLTLWILGLGTLLLGGIEFRIAGALAAVGFAILSHRESRSGEAPRTPRTLALAIGSWQLFALAYYGTGSNVLIASMVHSTGPIVLVACALQVFWRHLPRSDRRAGAIAEVQWILFAAVAGLALTDSFSLASATGLLVPLGIALLAASELVAACRNGSERSTWFALALIGLTTLWLALHEYIVFGRGLTYVVLAGGAFALSALARIGDRRESTAVLARPFRITAHALPVLGALVACLRLGLGSHAAGPGLPTLGLLLGSAFYFFEALRQEEGRLPRLVTAAAIANLAFLFLWTHLEVSDPQLFLLPVGLSLLAISRFLRRELPATHRTRLQYAGALIILVSPMFHILDGSWIHLFSLMALSVLTMLAAIGMRLRPLLYTGSAFLAVDLASIVIRGAIDRPDFLWFGGLLLGALVLGLGALAERNRERLQSRLRHLATVLETWD